MPINMRQRVWLLMKPEKKALVYMILLMKLKRIKGVLLMEIDEKQVLQIIRI